MDARVPDSDLSPPVGWLARERESGRFYRLAKLGAALALVVVLGATIAVFKRGSDPGTLISPPLMSSVASVTSV